MTIAKLTKSSRQGQGPLSFSLSSFGSDSKLCVVECPVTSASSKVVSAIMQSHGIHVQKARRPPTTISANRGVVKARSLWQLKFI